MRESTPEPDYPTAVEDIAPPTYTLYSYLQGKKLVRDDTDYYGLLIAAMIRADSENQAKLRMMWPVLWGEVQERWDAPGGKIGTEVIT